MSHGVIFGANIQMVKDLGTEMDCFTHYSEQKTANAINMERWRDGCYLIDNGRKRTQRWMAATPGLINGIDLDRVDAVLFGEEGLGGLFGGVQGTGRGGHTGYPCICIFVTTGTFNPPIMAQDIIHMADMKRWTGESICRHLIPSKVMDGKAIRCGQLVDEYPETEFCDTCEPNTTITHLIKDAIQEAAPPSHVTCLDSTDTRLSSFGNKIRITSKFPRVLTSTTLVTSIKPGMAVQMNKALVEKTL
jgi:hypothetical protein